MIEPRRVYRTHNDPASGSIALTLSDAEVVLDARGHAAWLAVAEALAGGRNRDDLSAVTGGSPEQAMRTMQRLRKAGLLVPAARPTSISGADFHARHFKPLLPIWLDKAFSHPFWERMTSGRGSARLYTGWLIELYHYTRNANRHMPLAVAHCRGKAVKTLLARHYEQEWDHCRFFSRAAAAMGIPAQAVHDSAPLPMTTEMSDFMRQAARADTLGYAICSAVLEGTTTDGAVFNPFYERVRALYAVPEGAVRPIYEHLELDAKHRHADLFAEICSHQEPLSPERAAAVLDFGHQMVEHIWLWTDNIEQYYGHEHNPLPRAAFDVFRD
jgi:pyrroloquinoline quinone (PQQ) biosynthesis protein C